MLIQNKKKYQEEDKIIRFLKGLNESFSIVKTQILLMESLPPLNKVFTLVLQQEWSLGAGGGQYNMIPVYYI